MSAMKYIAWIVAGLQDIAQQELEERIRADVHEVHKKYIIFSSAASVQTIKTLRCIDDVSIFVHRVEEPDVHPDALAQLIDTCDFIPAQQLISSTRALQNTFSVTISRYKNSNFSKEAAKERVASRFAAKTGLVYTPKDHTNLDIRIHVDVHTVFVGIKLFVHSLFLRAYEHKTDFGALRSTIAASMLTLIGAESGHSVADLFCGTGTFLTEAWELGIQPSGSDFHSNKVALARQNLARVSGKTFVAVEQMVRQAFVEQSGWPSNTFDYGVGNLPWNKQIRVSEVQTLYKRLAQEYARILKPQGAIAFICMQPDLLQKQLRKSFPQHTFSRYQIGFLGQKPTILLGMRP